MAGFAPRKKKNYVHLIIRTLMYIPHVELPQVPSISTDEPIQDKPPSDGAGLEQVRFRYRRPPAQVDEHVDQSFHGDQLPSVGHGAIPEHTLVSSALPTQSCPLQSK